MSRGRFELNIEQVFSDAKKTGVLEKLEDELYSFASLIDSHYEFKLFIEDPRIAASYKKKMLKKLCPPGISSDFVDLIEMLIDNGREELVSLLSSGITKRLFKEAGVLFGEVRTAVAVPEDLQQRLNKTMAGLEKKPVKLRYHVEESMLGGLVVSFINGEVWDVSLKHKLTELKDLVLN